MAGVGIRAPVRSVIGMAVETAPGQSGVAGLLLDEREQVDWSRSVARAGDHVRLPKGRVLRALVTRIEC